MTTDTLSRSPPRKLTRSTNNRMIAGVCAGIAEYLHVDPTVVRIAYSLLALVTGIVPGAVVYLVLMFVMPQTRAARAS
jgi:phage shock protein C